MFSVSVIELKENLALGCIKFQEAVKALMVFKSEPKNNLWFSQVFVDNNFKLCYGGGRQLRRSDQTMDNSGEEFPK